MGVRAWGRVLLAYAILGFKDKSGTVCMEPKLQFPMPLNMLVPALSHLSPLCHS